MTESDKLTQKEKIEVFQWLANSAWERLRNRRATEWKLCFGIWTAFGAATGFVAAREIAVHWVAGCLLTIVALAVFGVYWHYWLLWIQRAHNRDSRRGYWWESAIEESIGHRTDESLRPDSPESDVRAPWLRHADVPLDRPAVPATNAPTNSEKTRNVFWWRHWGKHHENARAQLIITGLFVLLFVIAVWGRYVGPPSQDQDAFATLKVRDPSRVSIEPLPAPTPSTP